MPFLLQAPTSWRVPAAPGAVNSVGDAPKSPSVDCSSAGTVHLSSRASVVPSRRRIDSPSPRSGVAPALPVVTKTEPSLGSTDGLLQTPAPVLPFGSVRYLASETPVLWSRATTPLPATGAKLSHNDAIPM